MRRSFVTLVSILAACSAELPDERLRRIVAEGEVAAEERDTGFFRDVIAEDYADARGNDRERLIDAIRGMFLTSNSIDVVSRIEEVSLLGDDAAEVVIEAAIVSTGPGRPLFGIDGDFYRLGLGFALIDDEWKLIRADWGPAHRGQLP